MARTGRPRLRLACQTLGLVALSALLLFLYGMVLHSDRLLYPEPRPLEQSAARHGYASPSDCGMPFEAVTMTTDPGVQLQGWFVPRKGAHRTLVMIHGHRENRIAMLGAGKRLWERGFALLLFDQRHHGLSGGDRFTMGFEEWRDARAAVEWLRSRGRDTEAIAAYGVSMGGMIAIKAQSEGQPFAAVVADAASSDIRQTIADYGRREGLPEWVSRWSLGLAELRGGYDLDRMVGRVLVRRIRKPLMVIHGEVDERIPSFHSHILAGMAAGPTETLFVPGAGHAQAFEREPERYVRAVGAFLDRSVPAARATSATASGPGS